MGIKTKIKNKRNLKIKKQVIRRIKLRKNAV
jgi:hypothetical protein